MSNENEFLTPDVRFHLVRKMERQKVIAVAGPHLLEHERKYIGFHDVAGVILFRRNVQSVSQVGELVAEVTEALTANTDLPPLILADHEGDFVSELRDVIGIPPAALAIAATGDLDLARAVARETGTVMKKIGVNAVLAPVADCYFDPGSAVTGLRTFGRDPVRVGEFVSNTIAGFQEAGVLTCTKHFPGHGSTSEDSHDTLPEVRKTLQQLDAADLVPFRRAIDDGTDMIMMAHVAFPMGRDELVPASFDPRIAGQLLRDELGYDGVVITDALEMAGARWYASGRSGNVGGGFERSLLAGCDLLLHTRPIPEQVTVEGESAPVMSINVMETIIKTLEKVVDRGRIDEKLEEAARDNEPLRNILTLLDKSHTRVESLRQRVADLAEPPRQPSRSKVIEFNAYPSVPSIYRDVAERCVVMRGGAVDLGDRPVVVMPLSSTANPMLGNQDVESFVEALCSRFPNWERTGLVSAFDADASGSALPRFHRPRGSATVVDASRYDPGESDSTIEFNLTGDEQLVLVFSARGNPAEEFLAGLQEFAEEKMPAVVVLTGWPNDSWVPEETPVILSLGASPQAASVVAEVLAGEREATGSLEGLLPGGEGKPL